MNSVRAFEAVSRHLSFTDAANELGVSQSAISQHMKTLELFIGCTLFRRDTKKISLTAEGNVLASIAQPWISNIQKAIENLCNETETKLTIAAPATFTTAWLLPKINEYSKEYPAARFDLITFDTPSFTPERKIDIIIKFDKIAIPSFTPAFFYNSETLVIASKNYVENYSFLSDPKEYHLHKIINLPICDWRISAGSESWNSLFPSSFEKLLNETLTHNYEEVNMIYAAALHGQGWAILDKLLVKQELEAGNLVALPKIQKPSVVGIFKKNDLPDEKIKDFLKWLIENL